MKAQRRRNLDLKRRGRAKRRVSEQMNKFTRKKKMSLKTLAKGAQIQASLKLN